MKDLRLPSELWGEIYSFDPTRVELIRALNREFFVIGRVLEDLTEIICFSDYKLPYCLKRVARRYRKFELRQVAYYLNVRTLAKKATKFRILLACYARLCVSQSAWRRKTCITRFI